MRPILRDAGHRPTNSSTARDLPRIFLTLASGVAAALAHIPAGADEIRIYRGDCTSGVHLVAHDARLSEVLRGLAGALNFRLRYQSEIDPLVSVDMARSPSELIADVAKPVNFTMTQARSKRCPTQQQILELVVLPSGTASARASLPVTAPLVPAVQETPEQARAAKEGLDEFMKSHGARPDTTPYPQSQ